MKFKYNEQWAKELLVLAYNEDVSRAETMRLIELIDMAEDTEDEKVISTLFLAILKEDLGGVEESIYGVFQCVDYYAYYSTLFNEISNMLEKKDSGIGVNLLSMGGRGEYTLEEWNNIKQLSEKYLNHEQLTKILKAMKNNLYFTVEDNYPYSQFYKLFQELLKEKSEK